LRTRLMSPFRFGSFSRISCPISRWSVPFMGLACANSTTSSTRMSFTWPSFN
jgi:hypothetical protein